MTGQRILLIVNPRGENRYAVQTIRFATKLLGRTMTTSSSTHRHVHARQHHENWRGANPWKTGAAARQAVGQRNQHDDDARIAPTREYRQIGPVKPPHEDLESSVSLSDVFALVTLLASAVAVISAAVYGAQDVLSEIPRYTTMDVIRMFGGMP